MTKNLFLLLLLVISEPLMAQNANLSEQLNDTSKTTKIEEVTLKAYRSSVKVEDGKLSYNIKQLTSGTTASNAYEVLSKLPGIYEENGVMQLAGAGAVTIIINGKPTTMSADQLVNTLKSMPVDRVKLAEVIYSAPPEYGVRGAAINLVIKQNNDYSYSGELRSGYALQRKSTWGTGGSFVVTNPKWSADVMYGYNNYYSPQETQLSTVHTVGGQVLNIEQLGDIESFGKQHIARAALEYTPEEGESLSIVYNGEISPYFNSTTNSSGSFVESISDKKGNNSLHNISLRYRAKNGFDIGSDYTLYETMSSGYLTNIYRDKNETSFDINSGQNVSRVNIYADMKHSLKNSWGVSYGAKVSWAEDEDFQYYSAIDGAVETFDTDSRLTEWRGEVYGGFSKNLSKGSLAASLTGEYYNLQGEEAWMLYPQANFTWMFNQNSILQANISSDKTYPSYWMLQEAISYIDGYTEVHGNPLLRPMRNYSSQVIYIHKQRYIFVLFASQTEDYFTQNAYLSPDKLSLIYKSTNYNYSRQYGANIMLPFSIGGWLSSKATLIGLRMEQRSDDFFGSSFNRSAWVGVAKLDNIIKFNNKLSLEINGTYQSPSIQGLYDMEHSIGVDVGVKVALFNYKLDIVAKCSDIFESRLPKVNQEWMGQRLNLYTGRYGRVFSLNIAYKFGGYTKRERKEIDRSRFGH